MIQKKYKNLYPIILSQESSFFLEGFEFDNFVVLRVWARNGLGYLMLKNIDF